MTVYRGRTTDTEYAVRLTDDRLRPVPSREAADTHLRLGKHFNNPDYVGAVVVSRLVSVTEWAEEGDQPSVEPAEEVEEQDEPSPAPAEWAVEDAR